MNFALDKHHRMIQGMVRDFAAKEIAPQAAERDESREFPHQVFARLGEQGMLGVVVPEKYGGGEMDFLSLAIVVEEISRACASTGVIVAVHNSLVEFPILNWGNEEQKQKFLPPLCSGEKLGAFCLTEPDAGSDAGSLKTTATLDGDSYVLHGSKIFITNAEPSGTLVVAAKTAPELGSKGISLFIVDRDTPGVSVGEHERLLGVRATGNAQISFDGARVPKENLLGEPNKGFGHLMALLDTSRIDIAAQAVGIGQAALDTAVKYSKERRQFGKPLCEFEMVQQMLAEMAVAVEAARLLTYQAAWLKDSGSKNFTKESAMCKMFASEMSVDVARKAVQIMGGYGYTKDYPAERFYRDAKVTEIYEGTNQIQRLVIARQLTR